MILLLLVLIIIAVIYLGRLSSLYNRVQQLEWEIKKLQGMARPPTVLPQPGTVSKPPHVDVTSTLPPIATPARGPTAVPVTHPTEIPKEAAQPLQRPAVVAVPSRTREEWEAFVGGKLLNRIGALALIIGVGFFLKYAFDNNWITESMRVAIGLIVGTGVLLGGIRTHRKGFEVFAQGLFGAGVSILYLSVYASFNFYHLISQPIAFVSIAIVTTAAFLVAMRYDSLAISILAWAGGFLTPFLISTGEANETGLFTYVGLLEIGLLAIVFKKPAWIVLEPLTLAATYLIFILWYFGFYSDDHLGLTIGFLSLFWGSFYVNDFFRSIRSEGRFLILRQLLNILNIGIYYATMYGMIDAKHHDWMGLTTLCISIVYLSQAVVVLRRQAANPMLLAQTILTATVLLILGTAIQFSGFTTVIFWSLEGVILVWCALRWNFRYIYWAAAGLFAAALIKMVATEGAFSTSPIISFVALLNYRALTYGTLAAGLAVSAILLKPLVYREIRALTWIFHVAWCAMIFTLLTVEVSDIFEQSILLAPSSTTLPFARMMTLPIIWMLYGIILVGSGIRSRTSAVMFSGLGVAVISLFAILLNGLSFEPIKSFALILNIRSLAMIIQIACLPVVSAFYRDTGGVYSWSGVFRSVVRYVWCLWIFLFVAAETKDHFMFLSYDAVESVKESLGFARSMTMAFISMGYALGFSWLGARKQIRPFIHCGLGAAGISVLLVVFAGFWFVPVTKFVLLLNVRAIALMFTVIGFVVLIQLEATIRNVLMPRINLRGAFQFIIVVLLFDLVTVETWDYFRKGIVELSQLHPEHNVSALTALSNLRQLSISVVWLLYASALIVLGIVKRFRPLRLGAIILLGISILKIFLYDLSFLETLYRIFSFIGLGIILLAASYLYQRYKSIILDPGVS